MDKIKKPKIRQTWHRKPETRVQPDKKKYRRKGRRVDKQDNNTG
ncbi:hypothetical protein [Desulfoscipio gibsoniae]|nr:hypothetical protein [Desulfoscipio gibsoniae]